MDFNHRPDPDRPCTLSLGYSNMVESAPRQPLEFFDNTHDLIDEIHAETNADTYAETWAEIHPETHDSGFALTNPAQRPPQPVSQAITATQADVREGIDRKLRAELVAIRGAAHAELQIAVQELKTKIDALQRSLWMVVAAGILINCLTNASAIMGGLSSFVFTGVSVMLSGCRLFLIPKRASVPAS
jgi:hypothetical protein